jgi:hypothetical protein
MHLVEISIFSLNTYFHRQTYENYEQSRQKLVSYLNIVHTNFFLKDLTKFKNDFENQNFVMLEEVVHNFGKTDSDII